MSRKVNYYGGSTLIKSKQGIFKISDTIRLKKEFKNHPKAQFIMSFQQYRNLRLQGKVIATLDSGD